MRVTFDPDYYPPEPRRVAISPVSLMLRSGAGFPCYWCGTHPARHCSHRPAIAALPRPYLEGDDRPARPDQRETGINHHRRKL